MATDDKNAKDLVKAVEKIAAGKAAKENQALASELDKTFSNLASVQEKLAKDNAKTAQIIKDGAAAELKANQEQQKSLQEIANSTIAGGTSTKDKLNAQRTLEELNLNMQITADKAEATQKWQNTSAGQALAMKKQMEDQGQVAEDSKKFQKLSFKARREDYDQRLAAATSPAAKKQIREDMRADAKKNGSRLDKIGAGIAGMWASSKKVLIGGATALLSTLAIGGLLIALGKFLQSDTFKTLSKYIEETLWPILKSFGETIMEFFQGPQFAKMMKYIRETLIPKLKGFYDAFFGPEGGFINGFQCLFGDDSGIGAIVLGIMGVVALLAAAKLAAIFGPLGVAIGLLFAGFNALTKLVKSKTPKIPKTPTPPRTPGTAGTPLKTTGVPKPGDVVTSKAGNKVLAGADGKATSIKAGDKAGKAKIMTAAAKSAKGAGAAGGAVSKVGKGFAHLKKYPLLLKAAKKIPLLGPILSTVGVISLLTGNASKEDKIKGIGGLLGAGLGSFGFGVVGAALGSIFPVVGNVIGGLLGSLVGWFGGEWAGEKLAGFLMGEELSEKELLQNQKAPTSNGAKKKEVVTAISKNVGDVMADRRIAGGTYKPGRGQDMGEDFEGAAMKMIDFAKKQTERDAKATGSAGAAGPTNIVDASVKTNNTNTGQSGNGTIVNSHYGSLNAAWGGH